eukprot:SAG11_NODE_572_length_8445_cov_7.136353_5_plen_46_part_00
MVGVEVPVEKTAEELVIGSGGGSEELAMGAGGAGGGVKSLGEGVG